jgi:hypothetical protein
LDAYARTFRALLSTEELPDKFSVTNSIQVASYDVGEEVDGRFVDKDESGKTVSYWLAGVVTNKRASTVQLPYEVFWLGYPPKKSGKDRNPTWSSVHVLRRHIQGTRAGTEKFWSVVANVRGMRIQAADKDDLPKNTPPIESLVSSSTDSASEGSDRDARKRPNRTPSPQPGVTPEGASSRKNPNTNNDQRSSARLAAAASKSTYVVYIDEEPVVESEISDSEAGAGIGDGVTDEDDDDDDDDDRW